VPKSDSIPAQEVAPETVRDNAPQPVEKQHFPVKIKPRDWAGLAPNGLGHQKPNHYKEMAKTIWENRDNLPYALRILSKGVCDGCALGVAGMSDWTMKGPHLCSVRLNLLRLNTMPALDPQVLADVSLLHGKRSKELRALGRLPYPMRRRRGEKGFTRISWDEALDSIATRIRATTPDRLAFWLTSRGVTNEVYYAAQKAARFLGTNNVDNAARICHSPSGVALKESLGVAASTCSYTDWIGTDLLLIFGSNMANDQPVTTKYLYYARQQGTKVVVINTYREPGMERYWIPSAAESALFGTKLTDDWFMVHTGGDLAFLNGVLKDLIERGHVNRQWIEEHGADFEEVEQVLAAQSWDALVQGSGASREEIARFADMIAAARSAVFVWSMGLTQHPHGVDTVQALINLALSQGFLGRDKCGLMPIRGHSGVQGGAEMGAYATALPGPLPINEENAARFSRLYGFPVPTAPDLERVLYFWPFVSVQRTLLLALRASCSLR
jgi:molybdopterin-dependent oxidoreductase alpha subunit